MRQDLYTQRRFFTEAMTEKDGVSLEGRKKKNKVEEALFCFVFSILDFCHIYLEFFHVFVVFEYNNSITLAI